MGNEEERKMKIKEKSERLSFNLVENDFESFFSLTFKPR